MAPKSRRPYLAYAVTNTLQQIRGGNGILLLPPMLITLAFCYSYVLMHPQAKPAGRTLAVSGVASDSAADSDNLPALTMAPQTSLPTLSDNVEVSSSAAPTSSGPMAQPSATNAMSLQAATASNGTNMVIAVNRASAAKAPSKTSRTSHHTTTFLNYLQAKQ